MAGMKILGWGSAHGDRCVSNEDMKQYVDTSDEWIRSKTGIGQRYFAENKSNLDMAAEAGAKAVAHLTPEEKSEIDGLVVATFTPDMATPSMAAEVAGRLGISGKVMTLDVNSACSGFVYGLVLANALMSSGFRRILLIGSEKISPMMDMEDRRTCVLFGDAAGAVVLEADPDGEFEHLEGTEPNHDILWTDSIPISGWRDRKCIVLRYRRCRSAEKSFCAGRAEPSRMWIGISSIKPTCGSFEVPFGRWAFRRRSVS